MRQGWCDGVTGVLLCPQNCLVRFEANGYTAVVGDFGLAEKIPTYRCVGSVHLSIPVLEVGGLQPTWSRSWGGMDIWGAARRAGMGDGEGGPHQWGLIGQMDTFGTG